MEGNLLNVLLCKGDLNSIKDLYVQDGAQQTDLTTLQNSDTLCHGENDSEYLLVRGTHLKLGIAYKKKDGAGNTSRPYDVVAILQYVNMFSYKNY